MVVEFYTSHLLWGKDKGELFRNALEPYQTFTEVSGEKKNGSVYKTTKKHNHFILLCSHQKTLLNSRETQ